MLPLKHTGKVISGEKIGRAIGFPTANLDQKPTEDRLETGVYWGTCRILLPVKTKKNHLNCLVYFGPRYVFGQKQNSFEVYIYDFNQDIYGSILEATLLKFLRKPQKTTDLNQLKEQLKKDRQQGLLLIKK